MSVLIDLSQVFDVEMGINLCGVERGVSQQFLNARMSAPACNRWVAKLWRRVWGLVLLLRPQAPR